ncbi:hypothetical protein [Streptomyces sp. NPDC056480]|uniref:hypothetical protein n=1 Tax=Streptomyces sp. NPDC056480 TaxID=3345833 RepID=UPI0036C179C1
MAPAKQLLLGLARALGEAIAVFMVIGRADDQLPESLGDVFSFLVRPGQTLTTKLAGPEPTLAGTSGPYFAALCGLGIILLALVAVATMWGTRGTTGRVARAPRARRSSARLRNLKDRITAVVRLGALLLPGALLVGMLGILLARGGAALNPVFWT